MTGMQLSRLVWVGMFCVLAPACTQRFKTGFLQRQVTVAGKEYCYQVFVPASYTPQQKWPVILFLHGAGERGEDCQAQVAVGLAPAIKRDSTAFPFLAVFPQCRPGAVWYGNMEAQAMLALRETMREFHGDDERVYLTGLSMGGYGTWYTAARNPGVFAALVPICGGVVRPERFPFPPDAAGQIPVDRPYETVADQIGRVPVWIFHGEADEIIPVTESRQMFAVLQARGANVKYTEYPGVGHNSWDLAYAEPDLQAWLLAQRLVK